MLNSLLFQYILQNYVVFLFTSHFFSWWFFYLFFIFGVAQKLTILEQFWFFTQICTLSNPIGVTWRFSAICQWVISSWKPDWFDSSIFFMTYNKPIQGLDMFLKFLNEKTTDQVKKNIFINFILDVDYNRFN